MGRLIYSFVRWIQIMMLKKRGWVLSDNVMISIHGVKKIGGGEYIVLIMRTLTQNVCLLHRLILQSERTVRLHIAHYSQRMRIRMLHIMSCVKYILQFIRRYESAIMSG